MTAAEGRLAYGRDVLLEQRIRKLEQDRVRDRQLIAELQERLMERDTAYRNLEDAVASARRIGAAIGIVMSALKNTEEQAFAVLVGISNRENRKLRSVADDIVLTGTC